MLRAADLAAERQHLLTQFERLVLVADSEIDLGKQTAAAIHDWGLQAVLVHDGVEAMLTIQRLLPRVVVLDAALPKMYGFQVCEVVKRNESLKGTTVALVGAIHQQDRYRRPPSELYGADVYLERPDLPVGLRPILEAAGMTLGSSALASSGVGSAPAPLQPAAREGFWRPMLGRSGSCALSPAKSIRGKVRRASAQTGA